MSFPVDLELRMQASDEIASSRFGEQGGDDAGVEVSGSVGLAIEHQSTHRLKPMNVEPHY